MNKIRRHTFQSFHYIAIKKLPIKLYKKYLYTDLRNVFIRAHFSAILVGMLLCLPL
jgi:hypothetical protein